MKKNVEVLEEKIYREEYAIRKISDNGEEKYIIKFFGVVNDVEIEITYDDYKLYKSTFSKPLTSYENQIRRKLDGKSFDSVFQNVPANSNADILKMLEVKSELKSVLDIVNTCTEIQKKRFKMYFVDDLTFKEIALKEKCSDRAVSKSIQMVLNKLNNNQK